MADDLMRRYLRRLDVEISPPSVSALVELHRAHIERIPYETFWLHLGEKWGIAPHESIRRIAIDGWGGYCFHLNGALAELLDWLGYAVTVHAAGVYDANGPDPATMRNHVALTVHDLPDPGNPGGRWWVDAGLGIGLHEPLPLVAGRYPQGPLTFTIGGDDGVGDWSVRMEPADAFTGVSVDAAPGSLDMFRERHEFNTTSSESPFATTVTAQRRTADRVDILRGCVLSSRGTSTSTHVFERRSDWLEALGDTFGLRPACTPDAIDRVWARVVDAHRVWLDERSTPNGERGAEVSSTAARSARSPVRDRRAGSPRRPGRWP